MPNIEIHGKSKKEATIMESQIVELFSGKPWENDYIITKMSSVARDKKGKNAPYLRLSSTKEPRDEEILMCLQKRFCIDIEFLELSAFYPAIE